MSKLAVGSIEGLASEGYKITVPAGSKIVQAGAVLQVVSTTKTDSYSSTAINTWTDITGYSADITPSSTSSKILVQIALSSSGFWNANSARAFRLVRGSTSICIGDAASNRQRASFVGGQSSNQEIPQLSLTFLDTPNTTSSVTYKVQWFQDTAVTFAVNRSQLDTDTAAYSRTASTITLMEIAG